MVSDLTRRCPSSLCSPPSCGNPPGTRSWRSRPSWCSWCSRHTPANICATMMTAREKRPRETIGDVLIVWWPHVQLVELVALIWALVHVRAVRLIGFDHALQPWAGSLGQDKRKTRGRQEKGNYRNLEDNPPRSGIRWRFLHTGRLEHKHAGSSNPRWRSPSQENCRVRSSL